MLHQIVIYDGSNKIIETDSIKGNSDTVFLNHSFKTIIEIPEKRIEVNTNPPEKTFLEIFGLWAVIIGGIAAFVGALVAFYKLFQSNKDTQEQLNKMTGLVSAIDAQNELIKEGNDNMKNYVIELSKQINSSAGSNNSKLAELEEKKLRISVKPKLIISSNGRTGRNFYFSIQNVGESCTITLSCERISGDMSLQLPPSIELPKNQSYKFTGIWRGELNKVEFKLILDCKDMADYGHKVVIEWKGGEISISQNEIE